MYISLVSPLQGLSGACSTSFPPPVFEFSRAPACTVGAPHPRPGPCLPPTLPGAAALGSASAGRGWCGNAMCRPLSAAATGWTASPCWSASLSRQMGPVVKPWTSRWESGWSTWGCRSTRASSCSMALMTYDSWWVTCSMSSQGSVPLYITLSLHCQTSCISLFMSPLCLSLGNSTPPYFCLSLTLPLSLPL